MRSTSAGAAAKLGKTVDEVLALRRAGIPAQRFGTADEFDAFYAFYAFHAFHAFHAFMCSVLAAYLTEQNIRLDGGAYSGTF